MLEAPSRLSDLYTFEEQIYDAGDRSKVFLAEEKRTGNSVVVKMRVKGFFTYLFPPWKDLPLSPWKEDPKSSVQRLVMEERLEN